MGKSMVSGEDFQEFTSRLAETLQDAAERHHGGALATRGVFWA